MKRSSLIFLFISLLAQSALAKPEKLIVMVFDAMRPDYINRYDMKNFKKLQSISRNYKNAYVGHLFSETVVAHAAIPTGLAPKDLPWADDVMLDKKGKIEGKPGFYNVGDLSGETLLKLLENQVDKDHFLQTRVKKKLGGKVFSVGGKGYAAWIFGGPYADGIITHKKKDGVCTPTGKNVPDYIVNNDRYKLDCKSAYGTENSFYPYDGGRMVHGTDKDHQGGDVWVADVALDLMNHEEWSALFLTFPAIDKVSHMMGEHEGPRSHNFKTEFTLPVVLKKADEQLGRLLDELKKKKLLDKTMIVVTADHGGQGNRYYFGVGGKSSQGKINNERDDGAYKTFWLGKLRESAKVSLLFQDSILRVWLEDQSKENADMAIHSLMQSSGVVSVHQKITLKSFPPQYRYTEVVSELKKQPAAFQKWANAHVAELINSMANEESPDLVATLEDDVGYGLLGDHGGTQEKVQRIPMIIHIPSEKASQPSQEFRQRDIFDLVVSKMGL